MELIYIIFLGFIVSLDGFFAGTAYGAKGIHVPFPSLLAIGVITFFYTGLACYAAETMTAYFPPQSTRLLSAALLFFLGISGYLHQKFSAEKIPCQSNEATKYFTFSFGRTVVRIIRKPECADMDNSNRLSIAEALLLGTALGIDNTAAALSANLNGAFTFLTPFIMCAIQTFLLYSGIHFAKFLFSKMLKKHLAYFPSILLIFLGICRLL